MFGVLLTKWTIRLALVCYVLYIASCLTATDRSWRRWPRALATLGCGLFLVHVAAAFHFFHHWSHQAAWQQTADETKLLLGVPFGAGIYFSYLFLVLWLLDVAWMWTFGSPVVTSPARATGVPSRRDAEAKTPRWRLLVHGFLLFIAVNGALVFESGVTRWVGIPMTLALAVLGCRWLATRGLLPAVRPPACEIVHDGGNAECGA
jgi:hypothetical protein